MNDDLYAVALYTHGSFHGWASDPMDLEDCQEFVADPPDCWAPRRQEQLVIYELTEVDDQ